MRERGKNLFWRLIWGQVGGEGHPHWKVMTDPLLAPALVAQLPEKMLWKGCQARDTLGFGGLRFSLVFDIPNPLFSKAGGLTKMKCCCAISLRLNFSLLWFCECHLSHTREKLSLVSGEMLPKALLPRPVQVRIIQRVTCSWLPMPEETSVVSCVVRKDSEHLEFTEGGTPGADPLSLTGLPVPANTTLFAGALTNGNDNQWLKQKIF